MSPSDFAPRCCRCRHALVPTPLLSHYVEGPYYCLPCAELVAREPNEAPPTYAPLGPKELDAALGRLDHLDKVATKPPWHRTFGFNNGSVATAFLKVPGHGGGAEVEMIAEDAEIVALGRAAMRPLLDEIARLRPLEAELAKVRRERADLIAEASRLRSIAATTTPYSCLIETAVRDDGTKVVILCAPDAETEVALAELMFAALAEVGTRIDPATPLERTGVTTLDDAADLIAQAVAEERQGS